MLEIQTDSFGQLRNPELFIEDAFIGGEWQKKSSTFAVSGKESAKTMRYMVLIRKSQNHLPEMSLGKLRIATCKISRPLSTMHTELSRNTTGPQRRFSEALFSVVGTI